MHMACDVCFPAIISKILEHPDADVNRPSSSVGDNLYGLTIAMVACINDYPEVVDLLLERSDVEWNATDSSGNTALMYACIRGNETTFRQLFDLPMIDTALTTPTGESALHMAALGGSVSIVTAFLDRGDFDYNKPWQVGSFSYRMNP
ncbi:hypothetical protein ACHHYP_04630 [Achlya hypogyna]|uniref:Uncharacterized protein n=1 Tax=Achlya hypogyna TaxID=1202772 RepID=A0A1V9ZP68_ACHHY|nr:hypothetical protein ACHHYP_04630 [Achlya hypogyna]